MSSRANESDDKKSFINCYMFSAIDALSIKFMVIAISILRHNDIINNCQHKRNVSFLREWGYCE